VVNQIEQINQREAQRLEGAGQKPLGLPGDRPAQGGSPDRTDGADPGRRGVEEYKPGTILVQRGEPVTEGQLALLREEHSAWARKRGQTDRAYRGAGLFLIFALLMSLVVLYVVRFQTGLAQSLPTIVKVCALIVVTLALGMLLSRPPWHA